jgi:hypothetical protein
MVELPRLFSFVRNNQILVPLYKQNIDIRHNFHTPLPEQAMAELQ